MIVAVTQKVLLLFTLPVNFLLSMHFKMMMITW
jgi:hypothetical protein